MVGNFLKKFKIIFTVGPDMTSNKPGGQSEVSKTESKFDNALFHTYVYQ